MHIRILGPGDEAALESFLARHADSSMFLRANALAAGLVDAGQPRQATYAAAWADGAIAGVVAHCWNGILLVQSSLPEVATAAVAQSQRAVKGMSGPAAQVHAARVALGLADCATVSDKQDHLFALDLAALQLPATLSDPRWQARPPRPDELEQLTEWRGDYMVETLGARRGPHFEAERAGSMALVPPHTVLLVDGVPVAMTAINARLPDMAQVGGVYTPPAGRGRGYSRAVVGASLLALRAEGVRRAVLFTSLEQPAARRVYFALGFTIVGDFAFVIF